MAHWTFDDIDWRAFDPSQADEDTVRIVKAAALVEHNGEDYGRYLVNVFADDAAFVEAAVRWAKEEVQHGVALGRWAVLADPDWDLEAALARFREGFRQVDLETVESVRGSRCAELIARCVVEVGTSSYYSALGESTGEPVLKQICRHIAADEFRHYKLFYDHMKRYRAVEKPFLLRRMRVALGRLAEGEDDELAFAWHAANVAGASYDRRACMSAYGSRALTRYRPGHVRLATHMTMKAIGLKPRSRLGDWLAGFIWRVFDWRRARMVRIAAAH